MVNVLCIAMYGQQSPALEIKQWPLDLGNAQGRTANIHSQVSRTPSFVTAAISFSIVIRSTSSAQMASPLCAMFSSVVTFRTVPSGPKPRAPAFATNANNSESTETLPESSANVAQGAEIVKKKCQSRMGNQGGGMW